MNLYIEFILIVIIVFIWFGWKTWEKSSRKKLIKEYDIKKDMSAEVQKKYVEPLRLDHNGNNEKGGIFGNRY
jgi:amino acid permease